MCKVSVIIPVYNTEQYLERCLNSLINQTLKEIEIVIVNDGSPDNSDKIIKRYKKKHPQKIVYIKKLNGGLSDARNYGLKSAKGEYIAFLDSDDYVDIHMYEEMYNKALEKKADIVLCDYYKVNENSNVNTYFKIINKNNDISLKDYILSTPSAGNKMFRNSFLKIIKFEFFKGIVYEDYAIIPTLAIYNPKLSYISKPFYYYIQRDNSITRNSDYKKCYEDIFKSTEQLYETLILNKYFLEELEYIIIEHLLYYASLLFYKFKKYDQIDKISDFIREKFPNWKKNKYFKQKKLKYKMLCLLFYHKKYNYIELVQFLKGKSKDDSKNKRKKQNF